MDKHEQTATKRSKSGSDLSPNGPAAPFFNIPLELRDKIYHYLWLERCARTVSSPASKPSVRLGPIYLGESRLRYAVTACYEEARLPHNSEAAPSWLLVNKQMLDEGLQQLMFNSLIGLNWATPSSRTRKRKKEPDSGQRLSPQVDLSKIESLEFGPIKLKLDYRNHPKGRKIDGRMGYRDTLAIDDSEMSYLAALGADLHQNRNIQDLRICFRLPQPSGQCRMRMTPRTRPAVDSPTRTRLDVEFDRIPFIEHIGIGLAKLEVILSCVTAQDGYRNDFWPVLNHALQEGAINIGKRVFGEECSIQRRGVGAAHWERGDPSNMWNFTFTRSL